MSNYKIPEDILDQIYGGASILPENWEEEALKLVPTYKKMYPNATFEQACTLIRQYIKDPEDQAKIIEFAKQFFDETGKLI